MDQAGSGSIVLGIGNELMQDDGAGVFAARLLMQEQLPEDVRVVDGGIAGLDLLFEFEGFERAVIIDAADMGKEPGDVLTFKPDEVSVELLERIAWLHQVSLVEVLELGKALGPLPDVTVVGIQPKVVASGTELSPEVENSMPRIVAEVRRILERSPGGHDGPADS